jgi:3-phosphoshikimate 1-carboxyvinyltransferase
MLRALGARVEETADGMVIHGCGAVARSAGPAAPASGDARLCGGARVTTDGDHRLVMAAAVAALACEDSVEIDDAAAAGVSFPAFFATLEELLP